MFLNPSFKNLKALEKALRIYRKNDNDVEQKIANLKCEIEKLVATLYVEYCGGVSSADDYSENGSSVGSVDSWTEAPGKILYIC